MKPGTIWLAADEERSVYVKGTIASEKGMLIVFWGIHEIAHSCRPPKESTLDLPFFCEEALSPFAQKSSQIPKTRKPLTLIHAAGASQKKMDISRFKHTLQPPYSPDITSSNFFFSIG
jgi:hypothetical protein